MNVTSPDISVLNFSVLYNLFDENVSPKRPTITFSNLSSGPNLGACTWWMTVYSPSNTPIHIGDVTTPDETGNWTSFLVPENWPQPFNQIEYSTANPYLATLYVKDSQGNIFSLQLSTLICRPYGNTADKPDNFAQGEFSLDVRCETAQIYVEDKTPYTYQGLGVQNISRKFTLVYPADDTGAVPTPFVVSGLSNALLPINQSTPYETTPDYALYMDVVNKYTFDNGTSVQIKYKKLSRFPIYCNIDLAPLYCDIMELNKQFNEEACGQYQDPELLRKIVSINTLYGLALTGKQEPLSGIQVGEIVERIKRIGGFTCNCITGGTGINGSSNSSAVFNLGTLCGDIHGTITQAGNNFTLNLSDFSYIIKTCDNISTTAFTITETENDTTCTKTFCFNVDLNQLKIDLDLPSPITSRLLNVYIHATTTAPTACPQSYFPANVWNTADDTILGIAQSADDMVAIINADSGWRALGYAFNAGNCKVGFMPVANNTVVPNVHVDLNVAAPGCTNNQKTYIVPVLSYCDNANQLNVLNYPFPAYVSYDNGATSHSIGVVTSTADFVSKIQADSAKPTNITVKTNPASQLTVQVIVYDVNCAADNTLVLYGMEDLNVLIGLNTNLYGENVAGMPFFDMGSDLYMGQLCSTPGNVMPWHVVLRGNFAYYVESNTGKLYKVDLSNPLFPKISATLNLPTTPGTGSPLSTPFSGLPEYSGTTPSHWDVYFPTDYYSESGNNLIYIMESTTGVIWKVDEPTFTVTDSFYDQKLIGKCPRAISGGWLYFSHDGLREILTGQSSGVARTDIVRLNLSTFSSAGLTTQTIAGTGDEPWSISADTSGILWIVTVKGGLYRYDPQGHVILNSWPGIFGVDFTGSTLMNSLFYRPKGTTYGRVYVSSDKKGTWWVETTATPTAMGKFDAYLAFPSDVHRTITPVPGGCYLVVTFDKTNDMNVPENGFIKYSYDGKLLEGIPFNIQSPGPMYNVITIDNQDTSKPNGLC